MSKHERVATPNASHLCPYCGEPSLPTPHFRWCVNVVGCRDRLVKKVKRLQEMVESPKTIQEPVSAGQSVVAPMRF